MLFGPACLFMTLADPKESCDDVYLSERISRKADAAAHGQMNFQTPATEIMEKIVDLHNDLFFFIVVVVLFVS